nr:HSP70 [Pineapple mealybug wilt-associated virus 6]
MEIGIDFGTTFSTVCYSAEGVAGCLPINGSIYVETQIFIPSAGNQVNIGKMAGQAYRNNIPGRLYINPKRWVGVTRSTYTEYVKKLKPTYTTSVDRNGNVLIGGLGVGPDKLLLVTDVICLFLKALIKECENYTNSVVAGCVVTVPADYNSFKRSFVTTSLAGLGVPVRAIINEPTAAALFSLARLQRDDVLVAVFDFGGGTFDVSFLKKKGDVIAVLFSVGDNFLGGRDIDRAIATELRRRIAGDVDEKKLTFFSSSVKEDVTNNPSQVDHLVPVVGGAQLVKFDENDLNAIVAPYAARAVKVFAEGLAMFSPDSTVAVLTGGSAALREVQRQVKELPTVDEVVFNPSDFRCSVAIGAKVYSDILTGAAQLRLIDTLTHTLSDEVNNFEPVVIFPKGSPIPAQFTTTYTVSGVTVVYGVYEGEFNRSYLNELTYRADSVSTEVRQRTDTVTYKVSIDGLLTVIVNGVVLKNIFLPSTPSNIVNTLAYSSGQELLEKEGVPVYLESFKYIHGKPVVANDLLNNSGYFKKLEVASNYEKLKKSITFS